MKTQYKYIKDEYIYIKWIFVCLRYIYIYIYKRTWDGNKVGIIWQVKELYLRGCEQAFQLGTTSERRFGWTREPDPDLPPWNHEDSSGSLQGSPLGNLCLRQRNISGGGAERTIQRLAGVGLGSGALRRLGYVLLFQAQGSLYSQKPKRPFFFSAYVMWKYRRRLRWFYHLSSRSSQNQIAVRLSFQSIRSLYLYISKKLFAFSNFTFYNK